MARSGGVGRGKVRQARFGIITVGHGRQGLVRSGLAWHGRAWQARFGGVGRGEAWHGRSRFGRLGMVRSVAAWLGRVWQAWFGGARQAWHLKVKKAANVAATKVTFIMKEQ